jgi:hypothetical protein
MNGPTMADSSNKTYDAFYILAVRRCIHAKFYAGNKFQLLAFSGKGPVTLDALSGDVCTNNFAKTIGGYGSRGLLLSACFPFVTIKRTQMSQIKKLLFDRQFAFT